MSSLFPSADDMTPALKRRWLWFGAWVLFALVALVICWVLYQWNWIQQRREMVDRQAMTIERLGGRKLSTGIFEPPISPVAVYRPAPPKTPFAVALLSGLGEEPRKAILLVFYPTHGQASLSEKDNRELEAARRLFPEATIMWAFALNVPDSPQPHDRP